MTTPSAILASSTFFDREEFPPGRLFDSMDPRAIGLLLDFRRKLGRPVHPSRWVSEDGERSGFARFGGSVNSRHYARGRLADAMDVFPEGDVLEAWTLALSMPFGGIGVYLDTRVNRLQPGPMLHLDLRPRRVLWVRVAGEYIYLHQSEDMRNRFWEAIGQVAARAYR